MSPSRPSPGTGPRLALLVLVSLALHAVGVPVAARWFPDFGIGAWEQPVSVRVIDGDALDALTEDQLASLEALEAAIEEEEPPEKEPEEPEKKLPDGQVVETTRPDEEKVPLDADYLAEHDNAVPKETRTEAYKVNPDVLSNQYSEDSKLEFQDLVDVGATDVSSGATIGNLAQPLPGKGAPRSSIPSPWLLTNREGLAAPTAASSRDQSLSGAPQNDLLDEERGALVALNTREFIGSAYINRIKRQVNLYWKQNLDNLPSSARLSKPRYSTIVGIVLTSDGALENISITHESGSAPLDVCVTDAFRIVGPFPNPPEQLISRDGRVYLSDLDFEVQLGQAQMPYQGIDPRSGVQFPGILKSPR